ncbi:cytosolic phospholipase A2-like, partial [Ruditapes philippinarum]|uniref:cytosolic phospholipase A2-like n=1 Tax=Ruditapes philippinarum TaxID=129788 RepID=UPI00295B8569
MLWGEQPKERPVGYGCSVANMNGSQGRRDYFGENICIKIAVKKAPDAEREASAFKREKFEFFLKEDEGNKVEISLMKGNVKQGEIISTEIISIPSLKQLVKDEKVDRHIDIDEDVVIKVVMSAKVDRLGTKLLLGHRLCDEEKKYIDTRLKSCLRTMAGLLKDNPPAAEIYVPRIAVMGSGGGFRAMTAFSGVMSALVRSEIADMVMYNVGLSGSAWYLSTLYSHPDWPQKKSALDLRSELRKGIVSSSWRILLNPKHWLSVASDYSKSQGFSLTNVYGRIISEKFLQKRKYSTMTNQQEKVKEGSVPLPLYAALNVKRETSAKVFHEWIEFSPFAIGMPKYGTFLQPKLFGSEFFSGRVLKEFDEFPLHFLLESEVEKSLESNTDVPEAETAVRGDKSKTKIEMIMEQPFVDKISNDIHGRAAVVNNFMRGLQLQEYRPSTKITDGLFKELHEINPTDAEKMYLVDAGLAFNSPFPLILRPEREVDLILSFDFSERESDKADPFT